MRLATPLLLLLLQISLSLSAPSVSPTPSSSSSSSPSSLRGVSPSSLSRYTSRAPVFTCFTGSSVSGAPLSLSHVNDGFCDCTDGSDEPGTNACSVGKFFFCRNVGSKPMRILNSRVDDGVCDCCDGADEPPATCADTCAEHGAKALTSLQQDISNTEAGLLIKQTWVQEAADAKKAKQDEKEAMQAKLAERKAALEVARQLKEREEAKEGAHAEALRAEWMKTHPQQDGGANTEATQQASPASTDDTAAPSGSAASPSPSSASSAEPQENFPYPAEYAAPPADMAAGEENFPYPKEYQFQQDGAPAQEGVDDDGEIEEMLEDEPAEPAPTSSGSTEPTYISEGKSTSTLLSVSSVSFVVYVLRAHHAYLVSRSCVASFVPPSRSSPSPLPFVLLADFRPLPRVLVQLVPLLGLPPPRFYRGHERRGGVGLCLLQRLSLLPRRRDRPPRGRAGRRRTSRTTSRGE